MCLVSGLIHPQIVSARSREWYAVGAATRGSEFGSILVQKRKRGKKISTKRIESNKKQNNDDGRPNKIHFNILLRDLYT